MLRMVLSQVRRRRGRSLAVVAAIVVAAVSFSLLTSAVATSQLRVRGTVQSNYRSAYDILVRPASSQTPLETTDRLVQENYLSGIYGGITMAQYHQVQQVAGVQVAAPIAMVGYMMPFENFSFPAQPYLRGQGDELLRLTITENGDNGLSHYPSPTQYVYVAKGSAAPPIAGSRSPCERCYGSVPFQDSAFDLPAQVTVRCYTTDPPTPRQGRIKLETPYNLPVLVAAIDPVQEARLVGLDSAMVSGRYLSAADKTRTLGFDLQGRQVPPTTPGAFITHQVPVLVANRPLTSASLTLQVQQVHVPDPSQIARRLASSAGSRWLRGLPATTVDTIHLTNTNQYSRMLEGYRATTGPVNDQFWSVGQVTYERGLDGHLIPQSHGNRDPAVWLNPQFGYYAPQSNSDLGFRRLQVHYSNNHVVSNVFAAPSIRSVGAFDPDQIAGFGELSKVPLTTYFPPDAAPGDARTDRLLRGQSLLPDNNIAGYLQQPPMMLTTIRSLHSFTDSGAFGKVEDFAKAPISVIRVRVAGVTGVDKLSVARVRLAAEQITRQTGLDVDITMGSSPHQELIDLPAGKYGRPPLVLSEGWVKKGVAVALLSAIDTKSLALFGLVLLVCVLFLVNATVAAVRTRRTELGLLACLGWPARKIFALLEIELVTIGVVAGMVGTAIAAAVAAAFGLHVSWAQIALITPVSVVLAGLAGIGPAWRACHATPMEAITPSVRSPRRAAHVTSITRLAITGLGRWPGRTVLGAASLFVGVAALAVLIAIQQAFQGGAVGTSLGDVVAVQVRGVDYLAAALTIVLGAFAVADVAYLNISERAAEIGTLRSTGWADRHVRRLFGTEGVLTAAGGAVLGAAFSVTGAAALLPIPIGTALTAAGVAALIGTAAAVIALMIPLGRLRHLAPANAITSE